MPREPAEPLRVSYRVDARATIVGVGGGWDGFAAANGAPALAADETVGKPLWHYVTGAETRYLYELLFDRVRALEVPIEVPFRCDAPALRRFMVLRVAPAADGALDLEAFARRVEKRSPVWLLDPRAVRGDGTLPICSFCKRIESGPMGWLEAEDAIARLGLLIAECPPMLSHVVCGECTHRVEDLLESAGRAPRDG